MRTRITTNTDTFYAVESSFKKVPLTEKQKQKSVKVGTFPELAWFIFMLKILEELSSYNKKTKS